MHIGTRGVSVAVCAECFFHGKSSVCAAAPEHRDRTLPSLIGGGGITQLPRGLLNALLHKSNPPSSTKIC